jgi:hypothetical protein
MEHFEIHIVTSPLHAELAIQAGLLESADQLACEHCEEVVGDDIDEFYPFAIVLDEFDDAWFVCDECYTPLVDPQGF